MQEEDLKSEMESEEKDKNQKNADKKMKNKL